MPAKKKTAKKKAAKAKAKSKKAEAKASGSQAMKTVAVHGETAEELIAFLDEHSLKGATFLREAFEVYKEAVESGEVEPGYSKGGDEEEEEDDDED